jgi:hypothetical protein
MLELFGLAGSGKWFARNFLNEPVDAFEHLPVGFHPILVIVPGVLGKNELHLASVRYVPPPFSNSASDPRSRRAFFGTRSRYEVSSIALKSASKIITTESSFCRVMITGSWSSHTFYIVEASRVRAAE